MPGFRWTLSDPAVPESYTFEYNPNAQTPLPLQKAVSVQSTTAPNGAAIFYEGSDTPELASMTFKVLNEDQFNHLAYWYAKRRQVLLTDDLGRSSWIYFTSFVPTRIQSKNYPWRHDIVMQYYTFGQQAVTAL